MPIAIQFQFLVLENTISNYIFYATSVNFG